MIKRMLGAIAHATNLDLESDRAVEAVARRMIRGDRTATLKLFKDGVYDSALFDDSENGNSNGN